MIPQMKTIVAKRTLIETEPIEVSDTEKDCRIVLHVAVYVPGLEYDTLAEADTETWTYDPTIKEWSCHMDDVAYYGLPYSLGYYLGYGNQTQIEAILDSLLTHEAVTIEYVLGTKIIPGHSLRCCSRCKHWQSDGYCQKTKQHVPGDNIIPCDKLFEEIT